MKQLLATFAVVAAAAAVAAYAQEKTTGEKEMTAMAVRPYEAKDFSKLLGMPGFSDTMLNNHFKLYQGYVKNANLVNDKANALCMSGQAGTPEFAELKRRLGWEFDGMRLHELYFGNLGGKTALDAASPLAVALVAQYGNFENWKVDFTSIGLMRGIGWVVLYQDPVTGRLFNCWIDEHATGHLAGCNPVLVMDVFEHAYTTDYQLDRKSYVEAFWRNVDWTAATSRYQAGMK